MDSNSSIRCTADAWAPADIQAQDVKCVVLLTLNGEMFTVAVETFLKTANEEPGSLSSDGEHEPQSSNMIQNTNQEANIDEQNGIRNEFPMTLQLQLENGTFEEVIRKEVLFVVDISGSMKGRTIEATKIAVVAAMSKLDQGDSFNVIAFNDQTYLYSSTLELATKEALQKATYWIGMNFITGGGTNMSAALNQARCTHVAKDEGFLLVPDDVLVATDVASKVLDSPNIQHVINYDMPAEIKEYVHRIERTRRRGKTGIASSFINKNQRQEYKDKVYGKNAWIT
ncbi:inter-alpha-trypsin inhibitor heavy chain-related protein [Tanacetum coccineum]|uniref:Inter-alpha-trypsin inhibitor heavy chain-related protein n=1 Tax=Tanacetum coccineum TaxID=301880 RepID=A0ABQ4YMK9_9ASTR